MSEYVATPRVIFIGDSGVGKTSIINRAKTGEFESQTVPTIGAGTTQMSYEQDGKTVNYQLWDTAGQEMYRNIVPIYFKGAVGAVITFSMNDAVSFKSIASWREQLITHSDEGIKYIVVGNKCDLEKKSVDEITVRNWAKQENMTLYLVSAKTGQNIDLVIDHIENYFVGPNLITSNKKELTVSNKKGCC